MATAFPPSPRFSAQSSAAWSAWGLLVLGLAALYLPSFAGLFRGIWSTDAQAHGPIVLALSCWLFSRKWSEMGNAAPQPSSWGWVVLAVGLVAYILGRSQNIPLFEIGSLIWILAALLLLLRGPTALRTQWFTLFFMLFMIPLPATFVDAVTMPMKMAVSYTAEAVLYGAGFPVARDGVILQIGQYKLLVADACAGLHTLFTLEALGLLYLNIVRHDSLARNAALAVCIVPISFTANVIRVIALTLITYTFGDAAGQGFLHGFAGMVLFLSALLLIIAVDAALQYGIGRFGRVSRQAVTGH